LNQIVDEYLNSAEHAKLLSDLPLIRIETRLDPELMNVLGSSAHLSKTLMNLVSNSAEAITGNGRITLATENCYIDRPIKGYDVVNEGDYVALSVSDTGTGIPAEDLNHIFEPFYTKKKLGRSGSGLGMAVVWGTVKDHYGYIDFESREGKGSRFTLYFPVTRKPLENEQETDMETYRGNGEKILVVDDVKEPQRCKSRRDSEPRRQGCRRSTLLQSLGNAGSGFLRLSL
jgi:two-component system cell cycle sensor histidine kinase/response regulator CckA